MLYNQSMRIFRLIFCLILLLCACTVSVSAETCSEMRVRVERHTIYSEYLHGELIFDIYIPPCMDPRVMNGYPVVYLLHGQDMDIDIWKRMRLSQIIRNTLNETDIPLFLTVAPQENQYLSSFSVSGLDQALVEELIPWIDSHYNTCTLRTCRSLAGFSRGALWTEKIAFEHPDLFSAIGMLSMPGMVFDDQTIHVFTEKHKQNDFLRIRMDTGSEDNYRHEGKKAAAQLTFTGYPFEYNIQPGGHNKDYWKSMLGEYFLWFSRDWQTN